MQGYQYVEAYGPPYVRGIEDVTWPSSQVEAIQNASYWHDGLLPYCTDAPACQPPEEAYLHLGIPDWLWGPEWNLDPQAGYTPQITLQHYDYLAPAYARAASSLHIHTVPCTPDTPECALPFDSASASPASPCGPLWSDLELPQTPPQLLAEPGLLATIPPARACTPPPCPTAVLSDSRLFPRARRLKTQSPFRRFRLRASRAA
ncbi:hypothetical protein BC834DRAFT_842746 [Gloeopeniophorella convolvens]|nr:hypothetical protein BC834DRAFT_842746 [Gloeopeniophorella convolvens]